MADKKATEPQASRRYVVTDKAGKERMIRATSASQAVQHVYEPIVRVASTDDVVRLMTAGVKDEDATKPKNAELPLPAGGTKPV